MRRWSSLLVGLVVLVGACSSDGDPPGRSTVGTTEPPPSSTSVTASPPDTEPIDTGEGVEQLDAFAELLEDDGTMSFDTALSLFAATIRPLPGVTPSATPIDDDSTILRRITIDIERLTPEQRAVVDDVLGGPGTPLDQFGANGEVGSGAGFPRFGTVAQAVPIARQAIALFNSKLGENAPESFFVLVDLPMVEPDGTRNFSNPLNAASATGEYDGGDDLKRCKIRLNNDALDDSASFRSQLSHEIFHCYQYRAIGGRANPPQWASEGGGRMGRRVVRGWLLHVRHVVGTMDRPAADASRAAQLRRHRRVRVGRPFRHQHPSTRDRRCGEPLDRHALTNGGHGLLVAVGERTTATPPGVPSGR